MSLSEIDRHRASTLPPPESNLLVYLCINVFSSEMDKKPNRKRESRPLDHFGKQNWTQPAAKKKFYFHTLFNLSSFFSSLSENGEKTFFYLLTACWHVRHSNLKIKRKKTRLFMNQQCVSMWVDKTASSCLVRFSLSYSVGQKVMPTGFKSHWKGPSCSARYCLWLAKLFYYWKGKY